MRVLLITPFLRSWQRLTQPAPRVHDVELRQQSQLLASLILVLLLLSVLTGGIYLLYETPSTRNPSELPFLVTVIVPFLLLVPYGLCHRGHFASAVWLVLGLVGSGLLLSASGSEFSDIFFLDNLVIPILIASIFLSLRMSLVVTIIALLSIVVFSFFTPAPFVAYVLGGPFLSVLLTASLILVFTHHRNQLESQRRAQLEQERNLLRTIIDTAADHIYAKDSESRFTLANIHVLHHLGMGTMTEVYGKTDFDFSPQELAEQYYANERHIIESGQPRLGYEEQIYDHASNSYRWVMSNKVPLCDENGKVIGLVGTNRDITELKQALDELKAIRAELEQRVETRTAELVEANARLQEQIAHRERMQKELADERNLLRTVIDLMPDFIYVKDLQSRFVIANQSVAQHNGVASPDMLVGKSDFELLPTHVAQTFYDDEQMVMHADQPLIDREELNISRAGEELWFSTTKVPLHDSQGILSGVAGISRNITERRLMYQQLQEARDELERRVEKRTAQLVETNATLQAEIVERKRAETALQAQERFLRQIIDVSPDRIFVKDRMGRFTLVNKAMADAYATTTDGMIGKSDSDFSVTSEENARFLHDDQTVFETQKPLHVPQESITLASGNAHWLQTTKVPLFNDDGTVTQLLGVSTDITERKRAEDALKISEERYRIITELISDYAYAYRVEPDQSYVHEWLTEDSFVRITGYTQVEIDAYPNHEALYHPDDQSLVRTHVNQVLQGIAVSGEYRIITKNGAIRWVHIYRKPIRDENEGRVVRFYGVAQDITERKRAEEALRASEEQYRTTTELISDYAYSFRVTPDFELEHEWITEDSFLRLTGYDYREIDAMSNMQAHYHPDDQAAVAADLKELFQGKAVRKDYRIISKSGELRWVHVYRKPIWDENEGRVVRLFGVVQDITERKQAEEALRASEERYRIISELISDYAFSLAVTPEGDFTQEWVTEDSFSRLTGYTQEDLFLEPYQFILYHPEDREMVRSHMAETLKGIPVNGEYRIITKSGELRWLHIHRRPIWDAKKGRVIRVYGIAQDITERKRAEAHRLELALEREQFALISRFVRAVSQYFRTSLANIETSRFLIQRLLPDTERQRVQPKLDTIHTQVKTLSEQLENLSAVAFAEDLRVEPCDVNALIEAMVNEHEARVHQKDQTLLFTPASAPVLLWVDGDKIKRAVRHLLMNAFHYTPPGGVIDVQVDRVDDEVMIQVRDTGIGIDASHLPYIFEPFYKVDPALQTDLGGVGLGLTVVRLIAAEHKGRVDVESTPGRGSIFTLRLPIHASN